jgi:hypothetical protein
MTAVFTPHTSVLHCHPETGRSPAYSIEVNLCLTRDGTLALSYVLKGAIDCLKIPPPQPARKADHLWQHTCFEAFISVEHKPVYYEFNFAPSGEWAVYAFQSYRNREPLADEPLAPGIVVRRDENSLALDALVRLERLPKLDMQSRLRVGLSAVIEDNDGTLSYWALKHPPGKPDFHHLDAFALEIDPVDMEVAKPLKMENR